MKSLLKKRWIGPVVVVIYALILCATISSKFKSELDSSSPMLIQEANNFLPVTFQNGEIVSPRDTFVHKTYTSDGQNVHVVLDTRTDTLDLAKGTEDGLYISKKCFYLVDSNEIKVECLDSSIPTEPWTLTTEDLASFLQKMTWYILPFGFIIFMIFFYIVVLFYTCLMHWLVALMCSTSFGQTLFVNTLVYLLLQLARTVLHLNVGFLLTLGLLILINILVCRTANQKKIPEQPIQSV